ncbi:sugar ABC transporter permease [Carnobacterium maltaromaticum]|uniref:Sugar ABC transporter permease n=1 Tax=Carnobacterium maltaromaticum TaxID=2751 RepID=A0AAW9JPM5_CARML|nr:sugar ABC transporter permease [Carnobacterium maltaromaticum]KRN84703.1 sugar ABC transporter permease [Carnobacterium maltaromaticum]MDT1945933.1 sugar ABC transporter permease [Carnobacterium maltaromaticum]MDT2000437.1 sugar ABC transporter permease [Carnobacterium maltaromaticum]MDZ5757413.1 sugar ABC transporter permease [Carnobacterium maltaromaticum]TFJ30250.1 sugar ABC transporter permease [Carnobacterium maltaromaticum]
MRIKPQLTKKSTGRYFYFPSVIIISVLVFFPMLQALMMSFQTGSPVDMQFSGLSNYIRMLSDATFKKAALNTSLYLLVQVPVMILLSMVISVLLNQKNLKFRSFFRIAIFLPCITSLVSYSLIMKSLFMESGLVNTILLNSHLISEPIMWLTHPVWAKVLIILSITWRWTGYNMIFFLSGLQNIDPSIYEAADIDGTTEWQKFFRITVPMLKPIILFTTITSTIGTLQLFDEVVNITNGGPANATMTLSQYIYNLSYKFTPNFGYAAAISFVIVIAIVLLTMIQMKLGGDRDD